MATKKKKTAIKQPSSRNARSRRDTDWAVRNVTPELQEALKVFVDGQGGLLGPSVDDALTSYLMRNGVMPPTRKVIKQWIDFLEELQVGGLLPEDQQRRLAAIAAKTK